MSLEKREVFEINPYSAVHVRKAIVMTRLAGTTCAKRGLRLLPQASTSYRTEDAQTFNFNNAGDSQLQSLLLLLLLLMTAAVQQLLPMPASQEYRPGTPALQKAQCTDRQRSWEWDPMRGCLVRCGANGALASRRCFLTVGPLKCERPNQAGGPCVCQDLQKPKKLRRL
ncbi:hypothetical protein BDV11DRAFT_124206 [Aspergillus similis]